MANRGREAVDLGGILVREPRSFPAALMALIRRSVRTVWDARGGGFYACGFVVTFVWLEFRLLIGDIASAEGVGDFLGEQLFEMFFRFVSESFVNSITALIWPVYFVRDGSPASLALLIVLYLVFRQFLKAPLQRWLFDSAGASGTDVREPERPQQ